MVTKQWCVYMVRCAKGALYTGMTGDVAARVRRHNSGRGARCLKALGLPVTLVYTEGCPTRAAAMKRERQLKRLTKREKEQLVTSGHGPAW